MTEITQQSLQTAESISNYNDGYELLWFADYFEQCEQT